MENQNDIGHVIASISNLIKRQIDITASSNAFTGVQGRVLHFILAKEGSDDLFQKDIENEFNMRRSTATGILQLMEKNALIRRENVDYDARLKKIIVTNKGKELKSEVVEGIRFLEEKIKRDIPDEDLKNFYRIMEKMAKNLE